IYAAVSAAVADQVSVRRRGEVGGWLGMAQTLGLLLGTGLAVVAGGVTAGYLACAGLVLALVIPYLLRSRDLRLVGDVGRFRAGGGRSAGRFGGHRGGIRPSAGRPGPAGRAAW